MYTYIQNMCVIPSSHHKYTNSGMILMAKCRRIWSRGNCIWQRSKRKNGHSLTLLHSLMPISTLILLNPGPNPHPRIYTDLPQIDEPCQGSKLSGRHALGGQRGASRDTWIFATLWVLGLKCAQNAAMWTVVQWLKHSRQHLIRCMIILLLMAMWERVLVNLVRVVCSKVVGNDDDVSNTAVRQENCSGKLSNVWS